MRQLDLRTGVEALGRVSDRARAEQRSMFKATRATATERGVGMRQVARSIRPCRPTRPGSGKRRPFGEFLPTRGGQSFRHWSRVAATGKCCCYRIARSPIVSPSSGAGLASQDKKGRARAWMLSVGCRGGAGRGATQGSISSRQAGPDQAKARVASGQSRFEFAEGRVRVCPAGCGGPNAQSITSSSTSQRRCTSSLFAATISTSNTRLLHPANRPRFFASPRCASLGSPDGGNSNELVPHRSWPL
ncbi:hypothetical protein L1887_42367 [Cichorium endivia]|nr:hypothetical protein L1887_42367 [Cichorium endivia]